MKPLRHSANPTTLNRIKWVQEMNGRIKEDFKPQTPKKMFTEEGISRRGGIVFTQHYFMTEGLACTRR